MTGYHRAVAFLGAMSVLATLTLSSGEVDAQQRLYLDETPNLKLYGRTALSQLDGPVHLSALVAAGGLVDLGPTQEPSAGTQAAVSAIASLHASPDLWLRLHTETLAPLSGADDTDAEAWTTLTGRHHLEGSVGLGEVAEDTTSFELSVEARLDHGDDPTVFSKASLQPAGFYDRAAGATLWWRRGMEEEVAWVWPVGYSVREVGYPGRRGQGFVTHTVSSGFGIKPYSPTVARGWFEFAGVSLSRTEFGRGLSECAAPCSEQVNDKGAPIERTPAPLTIERLDLRLLSLDHMVVVEDAITFSVELAFGGNWMWSDMLQKDVGLVAASVQSGMRYEDPGQASYEIGFLMKRSGTHSPDGRHFLTEGRLEFLVGFTDKSLGLSLAHRSFLATQTDATVQAPEQPRSAIQHGMHTEWGFLFNDFMLGAYHQARYGAAFSDEPVDLFDQEEIWRHELGLFLRYEGFEL